MGRTYTDIGLFLLRLALGVIFIVHGGQKAFGWFGGSGPNDLAPMVEAMGFRPAAFWAWMLIIAEFGGGVGIIIGLLTPLWALSILSTMVIAVWKVHGPNGFLMSNQGYEYNLALGAMALCLLLTGPGRLSLDYLLFGRRRRDDDPLPDAVEGTPIAV